MDSPISLPVADRYDDVVEESAQLSVRGGRTPALVFRPAGAGPFPGIAIGQEATGPNEFIRRVGATLAHLGYAAIVPDYYHGEGPPDPEAYDDIETLMAYMAELDFRRAAFDLVAGLDHLGALPAVDGRRLAVWGYCTGGTIALLAAALRSDLAATVLFYPSQPRFQTLGPKTPVHALDALWSVLSSVLLLVGEQDPVWPPDLVEEMQRRLEEWQVPLAVERYADAGHAFCSPSPTFFHRAASEAGWRAAVAFLEDQLGSP